MIVLNDAMRVPFEWFFATPPRPPAGGPRGSIFLDLGSACSLLLKIIESVIILLMIVVSLKLILNLDYSVIEEWN